MINKKNFLTAIKKIAKVSQKSYIPALNQTALIEVKNSDVLLRATDLKCGISIKIGDTETKNAAVVVFHNQLKFTVESSSDEIEVNINHARNIKINDKEIECLISPEMFPEFNGHKGDTFVCDDNFLEALSVTYPIAKKADDERLQNVLWFNDCVVGAMTHMLNRYELNINSDNKFLMPFGACEIMTKIFDKKKSLMYSFEGNTLFFYQNDITFQMVLSETNFPVSIFETLKNWEQNDHSFDFDKNEWVNSLKSIKKICKVKYGRGQNPYYSHLFFDGKIEFGDAKEETYKLNVLNSSDNFKIGIDINYLLQCVTLFKSKNISAKIKNENSATVLTSKEMSLKSYIMPMKI